MRRPRRRPHGCRRVAERRGTRRGARHLAAHSASPGGMAEDRGAILLDYIRSQLLVDPERALDAETPLISEGLVDSMGLVMLAAFVEERFGARIEDADLRAGSLETVRDVVALIEARL